MKTQILEGLADPERAVAVAGEILRWGGIVAIPTETVYGLAADATRDDAVAKIFEAKGRPSNNPLIVHLADGSDGPHWTPGWNALAESLAGEFWPGALTMVLPADSRISNSVKAGGVTVGLRVPAHALARAVIRAAGVPLAAPSANRSNALSPTSAAAVLDTLDGRIDAVLDGGECSVGIESTVLDLTSKPPRILRPGMVDRERLARLLGAVVQGGGALRDAENAVLLSPGMLPRHYAPAVPLYLVETIAPMGENDGDFLIRFGGEGTTGEREAGMPTEPRQYAAAIYGTLRRAEKSGAGRIVLELPRGEDANWAAILDRLTRAAERT